LKNAHLRRSASPFGIAAYEKIRLTSQGLRALHLSIFEQPLTLFVRFKIKALFLLAASLSKKIETVYKVKILLKISFTKKSDLLRFYPTNKKYLLD